MASVKTTFVSILVLLILGGIGAGGGYAWLWLQRRAVERDLTQARALLAEGQAAEANRLLDERLIKARPSQAWVPEALALRFEVLEKLNDTAGREALARQVLAAERPWVRPGQPAWTHAQLAVGEAAIAAHRTPEARAAFEAVLAQADPIGKDAAEFGLARLDLATEGQLITGKERLEALLERLPEADPLRLRIEEVLGTVNMRMLLHPQPYGDDQIYVLQKGDTLDGMGRKFKISKELIQRINNISDPKRLTIGRRLKIPSLDLSIVVNKTDNSLTLLNRGKFFKRYKVRTGKHDFLTPVGEYAIRSKVIDPPWTNPQTREHYTAGQLGNELGARWMGFAGNESLGIHEAVDPTTVGTYGSNGCVGLVRADVEELFDLVRVGTPVRIIGQTATTQP